MNRSDELMKSVPVGAMTGIIAGLVMAMYAMLASATFLGQGLFTPLYGIASPIIGENEMMTSMQKGVYFSAGPAMVGLIVHLLWSVIYGIVFAIVNRSLGLTGPATIAVGVVFGFAVMLIMAFVVLPIVGVGGMAAMIGWPSFTLEHAIFGGGLGVAMVILGGEQAGSRVPAHQRAA